MSGILDFRNGFDWYHPKWGCFEIKAMNQYHSFLIIFFQIISYRSSSTSPDFYPWYFFLSCLYKSVHYQYLLVNSSINESASSWAISPGSVSPIPGRTTSVPAISNLFSIFLSSTIACGSGSYNRITRSN